LASCGTTFRNRVSLLWWFDNFTGAAIHLFGDLLAGVAQQFAGIFQAFDLARRLGPDVSKLKLADTLGQVALMAFLGLGSRCRTRIFEAVPDHFGRQRYASLSAQQFAAHRPYRLCQETVNQVAEFGACAANGQSDAQNVLGLALADVEFIVADLALCHCQDICGALAGQVRQIHCILQFRHANGVHGVRTSSSA
jgi:hypothetical protein